MAIDLSITGLPDESAEARNVRLPAVTPTLEPGAPTDLELMHGIQAEDPEALSQLYDRYNGSMKALILRFIHSEPEAADVLKGIVRFGFVVTDPQDERLDDAVVAVVQL